MAALLCGGPRIGPNECPDTSLVWRRPRRQPAIERTSMRHALIALSCLVALPGLARAQVPAAIAVAIWHAEGAQVYECKTGADGKLAWAFREPIATLLLDGKTIARHYTG